MTLLLNLRMHRCKIMKEGGWTVVLCASFGFRRGDCISTTRLGRTSTQFEVGDTVSTPQIGEGDGFPNEYRKCGCIHLVSYSKLQNL